MLENVFFRFLRASINIRLLLSLLIIIDGFLILQPSLSGYLLYTDRGDTSFTHWLESLNIIKLLDIPRFILGISLILLSLFMINGSRIAWVFSLFLLIITAFIDLKLTTANLNQGYFSLALVITISFFWRQYHHHSLTSAGFVAVTCIIALLIYAVLGALYIGSDFSPQIKSVETALYFALICMTTVGFGDIVPVSDDARIFTITIIILGITVFTTSVIYIVGVLAKGTKDIVKKRLYSMKNHYVIIGNTPIAMSLYHGLTHRDLPVVALCNEKKPTDYPERSNIISGDLSKKEILIKANLSQAKYVFIMTDDDSENIFSLLNIMNLCPEERKFKTILIANSEDNLEKIRLLKPDMLFTLSSLASEILVKVVCKDDISFDSIGDFLLNKID